MLVSNILGLFTFPWVWLYNLSQFARRATAMLKEVMFQGRIDKYLYMAIKRIDISPLQRRQKSIELQVLIINKSLFDFSIETITGSATFQVTEKYTLPTINCRKHLKVPRNSETIYELNIETIAQENVVLLLSQLNAGIIE